ncbi:hypothetical protein DRO26_00960, partial [Candidatus Bathyarchaeota archaeon]
MKSEDIFSIKNLFLFVLVLFVISSVLGYLNGEKYTYIPTFLRETYGKELLKLNPISLTLLIFFNNALKSFIIIPLGVFLALPPLIFVMFNGFIVGVVAYETMVKVGQKWILYF